jgi:D-alanine-D-alanine ligase
MTKDIYEIDVAVLCGGRGAEREISLESGAAVTRGLLDAGVRARKLELSGEESEVRALKCDAAFIALHGEFGEDGGVQAILEELKIPYTGSRVKASALAMDKDAAKRLLRAYGIPTADWAVITTAREAQHAMDAAGLLPPVVVKPVSRGSSVGTSIVRDYAEMWEAAEKALALDERAMIETFLAGRELTVALLGDRILPVIEIRPKQKFYDYAAKYADDATEFICPAPLAERLYSEIESIALRSVKALGVEQLGRVDIILGEDGPQVLEVNTIPGFTAHSLVPLAARTAGIAFPELCLKVLAGCL